MKKTITLCILLFLVLTQAIFAQKQKIIVDCDIGDDIDDAHALSLLLASPEFDILGVVVDYGNTSERAQLACRFLYEVGKENIPVVVGRKTNDVYSDQYYWGKGFTKTKPIEKPAADFIIEQLKKYPNEVILLTVGPVPNISDIIKKDPDALKQAKEIISMFGSFYMGYDNSPIPSPEWNVLADTESAKDFIASDAKKTFAGLDVTTYVKLTKEYRERISLRKSPLTDSLDALYTLWRYQKYAKPDPTLYDAVAVGMILWPELFKTRAAHIKVTDEGYTVIDESKEPNCRIAMWIDTDEFLKRYTERILKQNLMRK